MAAAADVPDRGGADRGMQGAPAASTHGGVCRSGNCAHIPDGVSRAYKDGRAGYTT